MENNVDIRCKKLQVKQCNKLFTKCTQDTTLNLAPDLLKLKYVPIVIDSPLNFCTSG